MSRTPIMKDVSTTAGTDAAAAAAAAAGENGYGAIADGRRRGDDEEIAVDEPTWESRETCGPNDKTVLPPFGIVGRSLACSSSSFKNASAAASAGPATAAAASAPDGQGGTVAAGAADAASSSSLSSLPQPPPAPPTDAPTSDPQHSRFSAVLECFKYLYSTCLLLFSVFLVMATIFTEQTTGTAEHGIHPVLAFFLFWFLIAWLATMEGGQGCLVGLKPVPRHIYAQSHPFTYRNTTLAHQQDNMERFIVGRQFLTVLVIFVSNFLCSAVANVRIVGIDNALQNVFLSSGLALILITIVVGQLTGQVNAANCMIDFINNRFMLYFVTHISLAIEFSGLLHSVYLVQIAFSVFTGVSAKSSTHNSTRTCLQRTFFWSRTILSCLVLFFSFAVTLAALFDGNTTMWDNVPPAASVVLFFVLMAFVGMMEGMQIALFAVVNMPQQQVAQHTIAHNNCQLIFRGKNLQAFLIGRQICVTICTFVVARITTINIQPDVDETIFGVPQTVQKFFNTGLLGAIVTTVAASLAWRIIASSFPLAFLSNPLIYLIIQLCLLLEASGVCSAAWLLAYLHKQIAGFQLDETYIAAANSSDLRLTHHVSDDDDNDKESMTGDEENGSASIAQPKPQDDHHTVAEGVAI